MKKQILHAKRIDSMQSKTLIKDIIKTGQREWRKHVDELVEELNAKVQMLVLSIDSLKKNPTRRDKHKTSGLMKLREIQRKNKDQTLEIDGNGY